MSNMRISIGVDLILKSSFFLLDKNAMYTGLYIINKMLPLLEEVEIVTSLKICNTTFINNL